MDFVSQLKEFSSKEAMTRHMGMELLELGKGYAKVAMTATGDMTDASGSVAGGAVFTLLDEAFQYACNSHGQIAVAQQLCVYFTGQAQAGERLTAEVREVNLTRKTALYQAEVTGQETGTCLARATATAFRVGKPIILDELPTAKETH